MYLNLLFFYICFELACWWFLKRTQILKNIQLAPYKKNYELTDEDFN